MIVISKLSNQMRTRAKHCKQGFDLDLCRNLLRQSPLVMSDLTSSFHICFIISCILPKQNTFSCYCVSPSAGKTFHLTYLRLYKPYISESPYPLTTHFLVWGGHTFIKKSNQKKRLELWEEKNNGSEGQRSRIFCQSSAFLMAKRF